MMLDVPEAFSANMSTQTTILNMAYRASVSLRPLPLEAWVQSPVSACGICGGQTRSGARFLPEYIYRVKYDATGAPKSFICHRRYISPAIDIV